jgi:hypothetical protein
MKRIKIAHNRFLKLYRTESDLGAPIAYEIIRKSPRNPIASSFKATTELFARQAFDRLTAAAQTIGPRLSKSLVRKLVTGQAILQPGRAVMSRSRRARRKAKS